MIAYAENPPIKYHDIYPLNFGRDPERLYREVLQIVHHWTSHGMRIFRVDKPHSKSLPLWDLLLAEVGRTHDDVIFLAEAFTRPAMMATLSKLGFHQSCTYFTWRNTATEIIEYLREQTGPAVVYLRPNFANTPDVISEYLQHGGPPMFKVRATPAALLSPSSGIYSGFELCENMPLGSGSEKNLASEKCAYRPRDWSSARREPSAIALFIGRLNTVRRSHSSLHWLHSLRFYHVDQPELICFSKRNEWNPETLLAVVDLDPHQPQEGTVQLDMRALGLDDQSMLVVIDELSGESHRWGQANPVRLAPAVVPAHIFAVTSCPLACRAAHAAGEASGH